MTVIGLDPGQSPGDVELVQRCARGDELAGRELLTRHRDAVADSGPSPAYESVDASGEQALAQLQSGSGPGLPFRVLWLALHTQGRLPVDGERRNPVWDGFCALPLPAQTALWHREVEGQEATAIAALLGTSTDEVRRHLVSAYAAVRSRVEESSPPSPSRGLASQLLLLQYSLRDVLAGVVLGPAAGRYLVARPRVGRRVPIEVTPARHRSNAPYVALAAVVVGAVAAASFLGPAPVDTSRSPVPRAAPFEAPIVGSYLEAVAGTNGPETTRQRTPQRASQAVPTAASPSRGSSATAGGTGGQNSDGQNSGGPGSAPSGGGSPAPAGGSAPGGTNNDPDPAPADNGPGQGVQHASPQGLSNGVRAHGPGNKGGKSQAKGAKPGKSNGKARGARPGKSNGKGKGKGRH